MKLDTLVIMAHPDDAELACGGTIINQVKAGKKVGIVDLTQGEMGTRGTPEIRLQEAADAGEIMGLSVRENLGLKDVYFTNDEPNQLAVIKAMRKFQPEMVITNALKDRHPDHGKGAQLVIASAFMSGLAKVETTLDGEAQAAWRPKSIYHVVQSQYLEPDIIVDVSESWEEKMEAIKAYKSQFYDPNSSEPNTYISSPEFLKMIESRGKEYGHAIQVRYGEGFMVTKKMGVKDLFDII